jgi:hypothetical protein
MERTGGELIRDFLATFEIPYVFGNPGTTETTFLAAVAASKATYVLALHESSAVGIAAGFALITGKPAVASLHTYPGLANGMFNMRNALMSGIPLLVINGQQDSRFLIHNPVLGAPNTRLAEAATKYANEVSRADDIAVALQRCYLQARLQPPGPVFLSLPMDFMLERTAHTRFRKTQIDDDGVPRALAAVPPGGLAIVADCAPAAARGSQALSRIASALGADLYAGTVPRIGHGRSAAPPLPRPAAVHDARDRPDTRQVPHAAAGRREDRHLHLQRRFGRAGCAAGHPAGTGDESARLRLPLRPGRARRCRCHAGGHRRGAGQRSGRRGEVGPCGGGGGAGSKVSRRGPTRQRHTDPGRAAVARPHLWCNAMGTALQTTHFVGLDFDDPDVDVLKIAEGLSARCGRIDNLAAIGEVLTQALAYAGPSFIVIDREP